MFCVRLFTAPCFMNNFFRKGQVRRSCKQLRYKRRHGWTNLKNDETVSNVVFESLFIGQFFKVIFFLSFETFEIMPWD